MNPTPGTTLDPSVTALDLEAARDATPTDYGTVFSVMSERSGAQDVLEELGSGDVVPASRKEALAHGRDLSARDVYVSVGMCLRTVRDPEFRVPALWPDAETAWEQAKGKHVETDASAIPWGAIPYWTNGRHGHVAASVGGGMCLTTDYRRPGYVDLAPIAALASWCGGRLVGWAEELNGVDVWPDKPRPHPASQFTIVNRINTVTRELTAARRRGAPKWKLDGLEAWLAQLERRQAKTK